MGFAKVLSYLSVLIVLILIGFSAKDGKLSLYLPIAGPHNDKIPSQTGKVAIVTGANVGLGFESCKELMRVGATVIATARSQSKADETAKKLNSLGLAGKAIGMELALDDHRSIYKFSQQYRDKKLPIHILMLNAGVMALPNYEETKDGLEMQVGVNFIGHYYLQKLLQDIVEASQPSRIVILTSAGHEMVFTGLPTYSVFSGSEIKKNYFPWWQYGASKLFNIYHVLELHEQMIKQNKDVKVIAVHPGSVKTELARNQIEKGSTFESIAVPFMDIFALTANEGATTQLYAATKPNASDLDGKYLVPTSRITRPSSQAQNASDRKRIIKEANEIISKWEF